MTGAYQRAARTTAGKKRRWVWHVLGGGFAAYAGVYVYSVLNRPRDQEVEECGVVRRLRAATAYGAAPKLIGRCGMIGSESEAEMTLEALEAALSVPGVVGVAVEVRRTADMQLVLLRDETVDRTTDGTGAVSSLALSEVRRLDAAYHHRFRSHGERNRRFYPLRGLGRRVPTLDEALLFVRSLSSQAVVLIEMHDSDVLSDVCAAVDRTGMADRVVVRGPGVSADVLPHNWASIADAATSRWVLLCATAGWLFPTPLTDHLFLAQPPNLVSARSAAAIRERKRLILLDSTKGASVDLLREELSIPFDLAIVDRPDIATSFLHKPPL